jgi:hypothetical protein
LCKAEPVVPGGLDGTRSVCRRCEKVVDLWVGVRCKAIHQLWAQDTMVSVYSTTKGLSAMTLALAQPG